MVTSDGARQASGMHRSPVEPSLFSPATSVVEFWRNAGPSLWFAKDAHFDLRFRERFIHLHDAAARGRLTSWQSTPVGALAVVLLLDQFPRNAFRGTPRMYMTDSMARAAAGSAISAAYDQAMEPLLRLFFYLPFAHSEQLEHQDRSVELCRALGTYPFTRAEHHRDIIRRFGRFPHRNAILGRESTPEEGAYLAAGGYHG